MEVFVEFDYKAQNEDELTIKKGDKIKNAYRKEHGWMEGELATTGAKGVFPDNFVKVLKSKSNSVPEKKKGFLADFSSRLISSDKKLMNTSGSKSPSNFIDGSGSPIPTPKSPEPPAKPPKLPSDIFKARVVYSYSPMNEDELSIQINDIVDVIGLAEDGWFEGVLSGRRGVFPSNYVVKIDAHNGDAKSAHSSDDMDADDSKKSLKRPMGGIGFGNIFNGKTIELKQTNKEPINKKVPPPLVKHLPAPPSVPKPQFVARAQVLYNYDPTQSDELQLHSGEIINIIDKNLEDDGWWKGELNGKIGVFPDNFVRELALNETPQTNGTQTMKLSSSLHSSSSSTSSINSAPLTGAHTTTHAPIVVPNAPVAEERKTLQPEAAFFELPQPLLHKSSNENLMNSQEDLNKSGDNLDDSMKIEDLEKDNNGKLTHLKKVKQFNKRPPSFKFKTKSEKIEDAGSLLPDVVKSKETSPEVSFVEEKSVSKDTESFETLREKFKTPTVVSNSPLPPPYSSAANMGSNSMQSHSVSFDEFNSLKMEMEAMKKLTSQIVADLKMVQSEASASKQASQEQILKMQKQLKELIDEIDEEKKTRLSLQVELERVKKTVSHHL